MSNEVYTDLEKKHFSNDVKYLDVKLKLDIIAELVKLYPNNMELGAKVREFINLNNNEHK